MRKTTKMKCLSAQILLKTCYETHLSLLHTKTGEEGTKDLRSSEKSCKRNFYSVSKTMKYMSRHRESDKTR